MSHIATTQQKIIISKIRKTSHPVTRNLQSTAGLGKVHLLQRGEQLPSVSVDNLPVQFGKSLIAGAMSENSGENGNLLIDLEAFYLKTDNVF